MESMRLKKGQPGAGKVRMFLLFYFIYFFIFIFFSDPFAQKRRKQDEALLDGRFAKMALTLKKEKGACLRESCE